ncbi:MAG: hypothetical protein JXA22_03375 [Candidatus Thermoplasmatota archaeon]|nr:hypothetical protein [Candidatus Thermoplasmatota archaeon]
MPYMFRFSGGLRISAVMMTLLFLTQLVMMSAPSFDDPVMAQEDDAPDHLGEGSEIEPNFDVQFILDPDNDLLSPYKGEKWVHLEPGMSADYWVLITNMGDENDTFHVRLNEPLRDLGWNWYFLDIGGLEAEVELTSPGMRDKYGGRTIEILLVRIDCPIEATSVTKFPVMVTAISENDQMVHGNDAPIDSDELIITVGHIDGIGFPRWEESIFFVEPGEWVTLPLYLTNLGNKDEMHVTVVIDEGEFWRSSYRDFEDLFHRKGYLLDFEWTKVSLTIYQGQTVQKDIRVRVPEEFFGGDEVLQFRAIGAIDNTNHWIISEVATLIVKRYTRLDAEIGGGGYLQVIPGGQNRVDLLISNTYYNDDVIEEVYLLDHKGVEMLVFDETNGSFDGIVSPSGQLKRIPLEFHLDGQYPSGPVDLELVVQPRYFKNIVLNLTLNVQKNVVMKLLPTDPLIPEVIGISPGMERNLVFWVRNEGNCDKQLTLELIKNVLVEGVEHPLPLDNDWSYSLEWISQIMEPANFIELKTDDIPVITGELNSEIGYMIPNSLKGYEISFWVEPDETVWVSLKVKCPGDDGVEIFPSYPVSATLFSVEGEVLDSFDMVFEPRYPDLVFGELMLINDAGNDQVGTLRGGDKIFFMVNVSNIGQGFSERVKVGVHTNDDLAKELWIVPLAPGEKTVLVGNITISKGMKNIELVLDPDNDVPELDDQFMEGSTEDANIISAPLPVENEKGGYGSVLLALILIFVPLVMLAVLAWYTYKFRVGEKRELEVFGR